MREENENEKGKLTLFEMESLYEKFKRQGSQMYKCSNDKKE